jgi:16S rRNA (cytosine967-C5)-methyltransferase
VNLSADRLAAARLLMRVEDGAFSSRLLSGGGAPATRVRVLEVLRWLRALDTVLQPRCRRDLADLDPEVRVSLRLGLAEAMRLGMPPALATDGAVRLVRRLGRSSASGMVNAVLRKATTGWRDDLAEASPDVQLAHPGWLYRRWSDLFGAEKADSAMASAQEPAVTWVWFTKPDVRDRLSLDGFEIEPHPWCPGTWRSPNDPPLLVEKVKRGEAYAQDPSSQLVSHLAASLAPNGGRFVDLCAAPGGKSVLAASLVPWDLMVAADVRLSRVRLMRSTLERFDGHPVVAADALQPPFSDSWDVVLIDAPCSGTGTLRRHPEIKWKLRPEALPELASRQRAMLTAGLKLVASGGVLLYSTCSVEPEENEGLFRDAPAGFEPEDLGPALPEGVPWIPTSAGGVRILPNLMGDGFTIHALRRR